MMEKIKMNGINTILKMNQRQMKGLKYIALSEDDALYGRQIQQVRDRDSRLTVRRVLRELYFLLVMSKKSFFAEVTKADTRITLESCLAHFPRRHLEVGPTPTEEDLIEYEQLMRAALFVFVRLSLPPDPSIIYEHWLIDIPKMLDIASIYGQSNSHIVKIFISQAFQANSYYHSDFTDLLYTLEDTKLWQIHDFFQQDITKGSTVVVKGVSLKALFSLRETIFHFNLIGKYFPQQVAYQLLVDEKIQQRIIALYCKACAKVQQQWISLPHISLLRHMLRECGVYMLQLLSLIHNALKRGFSSFNQRDKAGAQQTYEMLGALLIKGNTVVQKYFKHLLTQSFGCFQMFFSYNPKQIFQLPAQSIQILEQAILFQFQVRQKQKKQQKKQQQLKTKEEEIKKNTKMIENLFFQIQNSKTKLPQEDKLRHFYYKEYDDEPQEIDSFYAKQRPKRIFVSNQIDTNVFVAKNNKSLQETKDDTFDDNLSIQGCQSNKYIESDQETYLNEQFYYEGKYSNVNCSFQFD